MDARMENGSLAVVVSSKGAELQSVVCGGVERIWSGDATVWGRKAPLLFPIIGRLMDGCFELDGRKQKHPMHGFCRDREFDVMSTSPREVILQTGSDDSTREVYPFDFRLTVAYTLDGSTLLKRHVVENCSGEPMPFELGGHEAYATRLLPGEHMSDYYIAFEGADCIEMFQMDEEGILDVPKTKVELDAGRLFKTPEQLGIDTIVLEDVIGSRATLASAKNGMTTTVEFPDFPYLGIWTMGSQQDAGYVCIEPWSALPDTHFSPRELSKRAGVITLQPGESKELAYRMTFA